MRVRSGVILQFRNLLYSRTRWTVRCDGDFPEFGFSVPALSASRDTPPHQSVWLTGFFILRNSWVRSEPPTTSIRDSRLAIHTAVVGNVATRKSRSRYSGGYRMKGKGRPEGTSAPSVVIPETFLLPLALPSTSVPGPVASNLGSSVSRLETLSQALRRLTCSVSEGS